MKKTKETKPFYKEVFICRICKKRYFVDKTTERKTKHFCEACSKKHSGMQYER